MPAFEVITVREYREAIDKLSAAETKLHAIDNAMRLLVAEVPALAAVRDKDLVAQVEFLTGSFLLSYKLAPKNKLGISYGEAENLVSNIVDETAPEDAKQKVVQILGARPEKTDLGFAGE